MADELPSNNEKTNTSGSGTKWLRILIVVAIGIPVLLEVSTLYNLVKVHIWGKDEAPVEETQPAEEIREYISGDTLVADPPLVLRDMRISVSPTEWNFRLILETAEKPSTEYQVLIDSLELNSGERLANGRSAGWMFRPESKTYLHAETWQIPNGDIPRNLKFRVRENYYSDSAKVRNEKIRLGPIPVRYRSDADRGGGD